jgi:cytidine deaminase
MKTSISNALITQLKEAAKKAQKNAYCPYTHYAVGAAVLGESGKIYAGCNVEPPTMINHICAERTAIANAITHGERKIQAVCTVSPASVPCGACRQLIREFSAGNIPIISICMHVDDQIEKKVIHTTIDDLLPSAHTELKILSTKKLGRA